jgi:hypothetical protein
MSAFLLYLSFVQIFINKLQFTLSFHLSTFLFLFHFFTFNLTLQGNINIGGKQALNSYARPDVRYCRDYFHSNVNKVCLEFWRPDCWHFSSEKTDWRERASAPDRQSSHERNVNSKGQQNDKKPCYILNVNSPVGKSHLVVHMCFYFAPKKYINL